MKKVKVAQHERMKVLWFCPYCDHFNEKVVKHKVEVMVKCEACHEVFEVEVKE